MGTLGFVVRDDQCAAVMAGAGKLAVVTDALCEEAHACVAALQAAAAQGMQKIVLESDSQTLVKALQTTGYDMIWRREVCCSGRLSSCWQLCLVRRRLSMLIALVILWHMH